MLAKQGWRLLENPKSLAARILKARYYPTTSFVQAKLGYNPSCVWRSIMESQKLIADGLIWRVGDGRSIKVWFDPWLQDQSNSRVKSVPGVDQENLTVVALFDLDKEVWDHDLLNELFTQRDRSLIASIPLGIRQVADSVQWKWSKDNCFSVKSAYFRLVRSPSDHDQQDNWQYIWNLNVPEKIKIHIWRAPKGFLPCMNNLAKRVPGIENTCPVCCMDTQTTLHTFLECSYVAEVW